MRPKGAQISQGQRMASLAARQHGVVGRAQLLALDVSSEQIKRMVRAGRLHPLYRGVYAVGHAVLSREGRWMAAVLACGEGAVLSHRDAAALWGTRPSAAAAIDVTIPTRNGRKRRDRIRLHRGPLAKEEVTVRDGIPVTMLARTLLDLAAVVPLTALRRAIHQAERQRLFDLAAVEATLERNAGRPGARALKRALDRYREPPLTRSDLERHFLRLCKAHGLPQPEVNAEVAGFEVDFLWQAERLNVETDGREDHLTPTAFEEDRARDALLTAAGYRVLRFTRRQVRYAPDFVARSISSILYPSGSRTKQISGPSVRPPGR